MFKGLSNVYRGNVGILLGGVGEGVGVGGPFATSSMDGKEEGEVIYYTKTHAERERRGKRGVLSASQPRLCLPPCECVCTCIHVGSREGGRSGVVSDFEWREGQKGF